MAHVRTSNKWMFEESPHVVETEACRELSNSFSFLAPFARSTKKTMSKVVHVHTVAEYNTQITQAGKLVCA